MKHDWGTDDEEVRLGLWRLRPPGERCTSALTRQDWGYSYCHLSALGPLSCYVRHIVMTVSSLPAIMKIPSLILPNCSANQGKRFVARSLLTVAI